MNRKDIDVRVRAILGPYVETGALDARPSHQIYLQSLGIESADLINVIVDVEDTFDLEIDLVRVELLLTLDDLIAAVEAQVAA